MRIVHIVEPFSSGITTFIINLCEQLSDHNHIVIHGARTSSDSIEAVRSRFSDNVDFILWPHARRQVHPVYDTLALISLFKILKNVKYDVIHLHSSKAGILGRIACFFLRARQVVYTPNCVAFIRTDISKFKRRLFIGFEKLGNIFPGHIIACGKSESELLQQIGVPSVCINNGISIGLRPKISARKPIITGFSGLITAQKTPGLFHSIAKKYLHNKDIRFLWVGDGSLRKTLEAPNIEITGWLKTELEVRKKLEGIHIFMSTASWEGQPFAVIEAMNMGKCLLLHNCPGNKDLVIEGVNGFLFNDLNEAVEKLRILKNDTSLIEKMGYQSYLLAKNNHDIREIGRLYEDEYQKLCN